MQDHLLPELAKPVDIELLIELDSTSNSLSNEAAMFSGSSKFRSSNALPVGRETLLESALQILKSKEFFLSHSNVFQIQCPISFVVFFY